MIQKLHILIILITISTSQTTTSNENNPTENIITESLINSFIVVEFEAKNTTMRETTNKLNELLLDHQKNIGLKESNFVKITLQDTPEMKKTRIFLHVKRISLNTILKVISEQSQTTHKINNNTIEFFFPVDE